MIDPLWDGERFENNLAQLTSLYFNRNRADGADATTPADWIPDYAAVLTAKDDQQQSDEYDRWYAEQLEKGLIRGK